MTLFNIYKNDVFNKYRLVKFQAVNLRVAVNISDKKTKRQ